MTREETWQKLGSILEELELQEKRRQRKPNPPQGMKLRSGRLLERRKPSPDTKRLPTQKTTGRDNVSQCVL